MLRARRLDTAAPTRSGVVLGRPQSDHRRHSFESRAVAEAIAYPSSRSAQLPIGTGQVRREMEIAKLNELGVLDMMRTGTVRSRRRCCWCRRKDRGAI